MSVIYSGDRPLFTPNYAKPIGLSVEEFLNCLMSGFNELTQETTLICSFYSAYHKHKDEVFLFFDQRPGVPPDGCDFFFTLQADGQLLSAVIKDYPYLNYLRPWVRMLIENKVIIQGVPASYGDIQIEMMTKGAEFQNAWH